MTELQLIHTSESDTTSTSLPMESMKSYAIPKLQRAIQVNLNAMSHSTQTSLFSKGGQPSENFSLIKSRVRLNITRIDEI